MNNAKINVQLNTRGGDGPSVKDQGDKTSMPYLWYIRILVSVTVGKSENLWLIYFFQFRYWSSWWYYGVISVTYGWDAVSLGVDGWHITSSVDACEDILTLHDGDSTKHSSLTGVGGRACAWYISLYKNRKNNWIKHTHKKSNQFFFYHSSIIKPSQIISTSKHYYW